MITHKHRVCDGVETNIQQSADECSKLFPPKVCLPDLVKMSDHHFQLQLFYSSIYAAPPPAVWRLDFLSSGGSITRCFGGI